MRPGGDWELRRGRGGACDPSGFLFWFQRDELPGKYRTGGGGERSGGGQEGTGGFGEAGKQCPRSIIYSWMPRRRVLSWQRAAAGGRADSCLSELPLLRLLSPSPRFFLCVSQELFCGLQRACSQGGDSGVWTAVVAPSSPVWLWAGG